MSHSPQVIAHRGLHTGALKENTLAAFTAAVEAGAEMVEFDVRRTAAHELVIIHDHRYRGVEVDSVSIDELERRTGFRPPLLTEVLDWAVGRVALDVELKEDGYVDQLVEPLLAFKRAGGELLVTSFLDPVLATLAQRAPELRLGLLLIWTAERAIERARACGVQALLPDQRLAREPLLGAAAQAHLEVIVWDFMVDQHTTLLSDARVTGVITDDVPGALAARNAMRA